MFTKFIRLMNNGKSRSLFEISELLGISPETAEAFIEYLSRKKMLSRVIYNAEELCGSNGCSHCSGCKGCDKSQSGKNVPKIWELNKKLN
ncbi:MAG: hypothetical protein GX222_03205 [Ruminococcaceae bacterium]|nr:hypothetical protein [Oscillospiraceae bacterium]